MRHIKLGKFVITALGIETYGLYWLWPWKRPGMHYPLASLDFGGMYIRSYAEHLEARLHYNQTLANEPWTPFKMTFKQRLLNLILR
ncbi:hypothetical protein [Aggregatilinea lenta]|uniref:hypothetical protein n=1 Tax=Aggregatilinea lenta TaxID=913108 RepID=UPI000E5B14BF|nr:hypothetical protein [Aggregatilinea lenta]